MSLTGNALIWWNALEDSGRAPTRWTNMKIAIEEKFQTVNETKRATDKLYNLRQTTSVQNYIADFSRLTMQIPNLERNETFCLFFRGLKWEIQNEMER